MIAAVSSHTHGCDTNYSCINGKETHIFFVHILTWIIYHYIDMCKVLIDGLCKLVDGENGHCDDLEGHSFY